MALKYFLDRRKQKKNGGYSIRYHIYIKGLQTLFSTDIILKDEQWNGREIVNHPNSRNLNLYLTQNKSIIDQYLLKINNWLPEIITKSEIKSIAIKANQLAFQNKEVHFNEIVYSAPIIMPPISQDNASLVTAYVAELLQRKQMALKTKEIYSQTLQKIQNYFSTISDTLTFNDITTKFLEEFDKNMSEDGIKINSRAIYLRCLRAIYNRAIDDGEAVLSKYPFRVYKIQHEKTRKRALIIEQIQLIYTTKTTKSLERYKDIFFLMMYLIGINTIDLAYAKKQDIVNGYLEYRRSKTGRLYTIFLHPEAVNIINKYAGKKEYILNIMDTNSKYTYFSSKFNKNLKKILPQLTTYWARHSWATIASELEIPKETIAAALGHGGNEVTDIYINFNQKKIDEANRKVIDYINKYTTNNKNDEEDIIISA